MTAQDEFMRASDAFSWYANDRARPLWMYTLVEGLPDGRAALIMKLIDTRAKTARNTRSLRFTDAIAAGLDLLPTGFVGGMLKRVDFLASDVTGMPVTNYLAGAVVPDTDTFIDCLQLGMDEVIAVGRD